MKKSVAERILDAVHLQDEPIPSQPLVEIYSDRRVLIEHHCGVVNYSRECIEIRVSYGSVILHGQELRLCRMMNLQLIITGRIEAIYLRRK